MAHTEDAYAIDSRGHWPDCLASPDSAGEVDTIRLTERRGTVHVEVTDASNSPVAEAQVYLLAAPAGCAPATRELPLHGRA